jgi:hypothetical protein
LENSPTFSSSSSLEACIAFGATLKFRDFLCCVFLKVDF